MSSVATSAVPELLVVAEAPFPISSASPQWCTLLGVEEDDIKGCGFKVFDANFHPLTQSKVAAYGGKDDMSNEVSAAMVTAIEERRPLYVPATLELDMQTAHSASCPPTRKISLMIEPVLDTVVVNTKMTTEDPSTTDTDTTMDLPKPLLVRITLKELDMLSMQDSMCELRTRRAMVISHINAPYRIAHVNSTWKEFFGLGEKESVGRSLKMIEGPLTRQASLLGVYDAVSSGVSIKSQIISYNMDGRPFVNHIHVVPIQGEHTQVATTSTVIGKKINPHLALAAAAGVTHCLWYMDVHEAVTQKDAMSDVFYPNSAKVMTSTVAPFDILDINLAWSKACMLPRSAVLGKTLSLVQGPATDQNMTSELCKKALATKSHYTEIINYRADGQPFINRLQIIQY